MNTKSASILGVAIVAAALILSNGRGAPGPGEMFASLFRSEAARVCISEVRLRLKAPQTMRVTHLDDISSTYNDGTVFFNFRAVNSFNAPIEGSAECSGAVSETQKLAGFNLISIASEHYESSVTMATAALNGAIGRGPETTVERYEVSVPIPGRGL